MSKQKIKGSGRFNLITSTISTTLVLMLLGIVVFFTLVSHNFSKELRENFMVEVLLHDSIPHANLSQLQQDLRKAPYARSVQYLSKEKGTQEMSKALEEAAEEFQSFNPIPAEFEVYLKADYAVQDSIDVFEKQLRATPYVTDVIYPKDAMGNVNNLLPIIGAVLLGLAALLIVISFALINNTMRMSIYAHRFAINTMKLVGAKWSFIRRPYLRRALGVGFVASVLAGGCCAAGMYYLWSLDNLISRLITLPVVGITLGVVVVLGLLITLVSAFFSVNRFLRMKTDEVALN